ncbi:MAG TPA: transcriptional regulator [Candidatus Thermoplasmatota archaeon]|nr:transcriptional regulator [Candidatus Thermoplasmatota archaeon]
MGDPLDVPEPAFDAVIHQPTRLRIMAALYRNRVASFTALRDGLGLTDGNLATHAAKLQEAGYVESRRVLAGLSFEVRYSITSKGSEAFRAYAAALRDFLEVAEAAPEAGAPPRAARGAPGEAL